MSIYFSESKQSFFLSELEYGDLPADLIEITQEQHVFALTKINEGCHVFSDLTFSKPKPTIYHTWNGKNWEDHRTQDEKNEALIRSLRPLTRRQFMLSLVEFKLDEKIEIAISEIKNEKQRKRINIEYKESQTFERMNESVLYMFNLMDLNYSKINEIWMYGLDQ